MTTIFDLPARAPENPSAVRTLGRADVVLPDLEGDYVVEWQVEDVGRRASPPQMHPVLEIFFT